MLTCNRNFKVIMLSYIALVMLVSLLEVLFLLNYYWVAEMLREMMELLMFLCIRWECGVSFNIDGCLPVGHSACGVAICTTNYQT